MVETKTDKRTVTMSALVMLAIALGTPIVEDMFSIDEYVCEDRLELNSYPCEDFSQFYELPNGKCINSVTGNKLCRTGWVELVDEENVTVSDITISDIGEVIIEYNGDWGCPDTEPSSICIRTKGDHTWKMPYYKLLSKKSEQNDTIMRIT